MSSAKNVGLPASVLQHPTVKSSACTDDVLMLLIDILSLPQATIELCQTHAADVNVLKVLFSSLTLISKLFYSLNFQVSSRCSALMRRRGTTNTPTIKHLDSSLFNAGPSGVFRRQHGNLDDKLPRSPDVGQQAATN